MYARGRTSAGFTLIEMMIAVALMAILLSIAVPSFRDASLGSQLRAAANDLTASAHLARSEAIKRNAPVTLCVSSNGTTCGTGGWQQGWIVLSGATVLERHAGMPAGYRINSTIDEIDFSPLGIGATPATLTVCRGAPDVGSQERIVTISAVGRPSVHKTATGTCP